MTIIFSRLETKVAVVVGLTLLKDVALYKYGYSKGYENGFETGQTMHHVLNNPSWKDDFCNMVDDVTTILKRMNEEKKHG